MKAIVNRAYGSPDVMEYLEVPKPTPKNGEVLVKIRAASVNALDWHVLRADPFLVRLACGFFKPKYPTLGADIAGQVEAVGNGVIRLKPGDEVYGDLFPSGLGGFAEYACAPEGLLALKPANLSFEEAAAVPVAALTALQSLRDYGHIASGQKVIINGAGGGVGTFAVQIAKAFGAEVTAVCGAQNQDLARSLGADQVVDYAKDDFTRNGKRYDLILAANGYHPILDYRRSLETKGIYVMSGGAGAQMAQVAFFGFLLSLFGDRKMVMGSCKANLKDLDILRELIESGKVKPTIDRRYSLAQVPDAVRYLEEGHARGKVVITIG